MDNSSLITTADPLKSLACACRFRSKCTQSDKHPLSAIELRSDTYRQQCVLRYSDVELKKNGAVDHIIELWQVKRAFYRAATFFELWDSRDAWLQQLNNEGTLANDLTIGKDWLNCNCNPELLNQRRLVKLANNMIVANDFPHANPGQFLDRVWWPQKTTATLQSLEDLLSIFNRTDNLCMIKSDFNLNKKSLLMHDTGTNLTTKLQNTRPLLLAYYNAIADHREYILNTLDRTFWETGNVYFWAVRRILQDDHQGFLNECANVNVQVGNAAAGYQLTDLATQFAGLTPVQRGQLIDGMLGDIGNM